MRCCKNFAKWFEDSADLTPPTNVENHTLVLYSKDLWLSRARPDNLPPRIDIESNHRDMNYLASLVFT